MHLFIQRRFETSVEHSFAAKLSYNFEEKKIVFFLLQSHTEYCRHSVQPNAENAVGNTVNDENIDSQKRVLKNRTKNKASGTRARNVIFVAIA